VRRLMFFFPPSFDMWKEQGKGVSFIFKTFFFIIEWVGRGVRVIFLLICRRGMGGGRDRIFLTSSLWEGGG